MRELSIFAVLVGLGVVLVIGLGQLTPLEAENHEEEVKAFVGEIEEAHGMSNWPAGKVLKVDISFAPPGQEFVKGTMWMNSTFAKQRFVDGKGHVYGFDAETAWKEDAKTPSMAGPGTRFLLPTLAYFVGAPFKLSDPGVNLELKEEQMVLTEGGEAYDAAKMTFDAGVGDAPDDWYVVYKNPETGVMEGMAYIVTYSKSREEAEETPSCVVYKNYTDVNGLKLSQDWTFYYWDEEKGGSGEPKYLATVRKMTFVDGDDSLFSMPEGGVEEPLPGN